MQDEHTSDRQAALQRVLSNRAFWAKKLEYIENTRDTELLRDIYEALRAEPAPLDPFSLRIFDAVRRELEWRADAERHRYQARSQQPGDQPDAAVAPLPVGPPVTRLDLLLAEYHEELRAVRARTQKRPTQEAWAEQRGDDLRTLQRRLEAYELVDDRFKWPRLLSDSGTA